MKLDLKIIESEQYISEQILKAIAQHLQQGITKARPKIIDGLQTMLKEAITSQPEYGALLHGDLRKELGIPQAGNRVNSIVDTWIENFSVSTIPVSVKGKQISGGLSINMIKSDYSDVLSLPEATVIDTESGSIIPWLSWLLLAGGDILVRNYDVKFVSPTPRSRTNTALMVSSKKNWRMPAQFAGTARNNWVYRAISTLDKKIPSMIQRELEKSL